MFHVFFFFFNYTYALPNDLLFFFQRLLFSLTLEGVSLELFLQTPKEAYRAVSKCPTKKITKIRSVGNSFNTPKFYLNKTSVMNCAPTVQKVKANPQRKQKSRSSLILGTFTSVHFGPFTIASNTALKVCAFT